MTYIYIHIPPTELELLVTHQLWATVSRSNPKHHRETGEVYIYCVIKLLHVWKTNFPCVYVCVCCNAKRVGTWPQTSPLSATRASRHQQTPKTNQPERDQQPRSHGARGKFTEGTFKGEGQGRIITCVTQALRYIFCCMIKLAYRSRRDSFYLYNADVNHRWKVYISLFHQKKKLYLT